MLATPSFFHKDHVGDLYVERPWEVAEAARKLKELKWVKPSTQDNPRIAVLAIDCQVDFCSPKGSLYVKGAEKDLERVLLWFYKNIHLLTDLYFTLDTHHIHQIFHPAWWVDLSGRNPPPLTVITADEVKNGTWIPTKYSKESLLYLEALESQSYRHTIWPYHALQGTSGHALMPSLSEAALYHSILRESTTHFEFKGTHPLTESYSVFKPEVTQVGDLKVGSLNTVLLDQLKTYDRVYVFGQASSHCVAESLKDIVKNSTPEEVSKFHVLVDGMSPVPPPPLNPLPSGLNFPKIAEEMLKFVEEKGMVLTKTSEEISF